jgi:hypothetical protein
MIYIHCKFYNVIKINYGGPDTGHVRPATAGRSLETMWDPQHLTALEASTACYGDNLTLYFYSLC